jgi:hypothetical protein
MDPHQFCRISHEGTPRKSINVPTTISNSAGFTEVHLEFWNSRIVSMSWHIVANLHRIANYSRCVKNKLKEPSKVIKFLSVSKAKAPPGSL